MTRIPLRRRYLLAVAAAAVVAASLFASVALSGSSRSSATVAHWPSRSLERVLGLTRMPQTPKAPLFALRDQHGRPVALAALRGRVVVLEAMDPHCTDICPIVSQEFAIAARQLGPEARRVVFLGVNVNQYHERPAEVDAFSRHHGLDRLAGWHFLTGSTRALKRVWADYQISVQPSKTGDVTHSTVMYFIGPQGRERWIAFPNSDKPGIPAFGAGIATVARHLLAPQTG